MHARSKQQFNKRKGSWPWTGKSTNQNPSSILALFPNARLLFNPRNPGYILQRQTLWGGGCHPPYKQSLPGCFWAVLLYHPWNIYKWGAHAKNWVTGFHILVGGPPRTFIFWACLIWTSDSWQIWQNLCFADLYLQISLKIKPKLQDT